MKILIVYDSLFGNTEKIAQAIGEAFRGHEVQILLAKDAQAAHLQGIGFLVVGSPTHGGRPSEQTKKFLDRLQATTLTNIKAATFDTSIPTQGQKRFTRWIVKLLGYAAKRIAKHLTRMGTTVIAKESFFVLGKEGPLLEGELARAKEWAGKMLVA
jgi:flavodoxin